MVSTVIIVIAILAAAPAMSSSSFVWTSFNNTTGFPNTGYVVIIGSLTTLYGLSGYESASQAAEETHNA
jgi:amino acid transporter